MMATVAILTSSPSRYVLLQFNRDKDPHRGTGRETPQATGSARIERSLVDAPRQWSEDAEARFRRRVCAKTFSTGLSPGGVGRQGHQRELAATQPLDHIGGANAPANGPLIRKIWSALGERCSMNCEKREPRVAVTLSPLPRQKLAGASVQASGNAMGAVVALPLVRTRRSPTGLGIALGHRGLAGRGQFVFRELDHLCWLLPTLPGDGFDAPDQALVSQSGEWTARRPRR